MKFHTEHSSHATVLCMKFHMDSLIEIFVKIRKDRGDLKESKGEMRFRSVGWLKCILWVSKLGKVSIEDGFQMNYLYGTRYNTIHYNMM